MDCEGVGAVSSDRLEDGIGGLGPDERAGFIVMGWMKPSMAALSSRTLRWTRRLICFSARSANQRSSWFSREVLTGVKWGCWRGWRASQALAGGALWVACCRAPDECRDRRHRLRDLRQEFAEFDRAMFRLAGPMTRPVAMSRAANNEVVPWRR
jgi:hypothetical protein